MEEGNLIERLLLFGLSRQEAAIYLCLLKNGELTGYEVAKQTGISRSNVYNGLASLVEQGAAYVMEGTSAKYTPVAMEEFCDNRIRYMSKERDVLVKNSPVRNLPLEGYITIEGYSHIEDKIYQMLKGAEYRIYFSASSTFISKWAKEIKELTARGIKVVLISDKPLENTENIIFYQSVATDEEWEERARQLRLIIDSAYVLTGEVEGASKDTCLYSAQKNFVNVFKEAMRNEIRLIELTCKEK